MGKLVPFGVSPLAYLVRVVISLCPKEKVFRIYANGVVAPVQNMKLVRNITEMNNPREAMCWVNAAEWNVSFQSPVGV